MRKYAREAVAKHPSIARLSESVSGARRTGSIGTIEAYAKGVNKLVGFLGFENPEKALAAIRAGRWIRLLRWISLLARRWKAVHMGLLETACSGSRSGLSLAV